MQMNYKKILILGACVVATVAIFAITNTIFGTQTDWLAQHTVFPDYFRKLFYATGNLFPSFASNIGGGQNIFNFSYYGLLNPLLLPSYLLPMVDMYTYISVLNIALIFSTIGLTYWWLQRNGYASSISWGSAILLGLTTAMVHHASHHIMFMNYMPFLLLALLGVDIYFETKRRWVYVLSLWFIIMVSYFYSVGAGLVIFLYYIYKYIRLSKFTSIKRMIIDGFWFCVPMLLSILLSMVLILPTVYALLQGRDASNQIAIAQLFKININLKVILHNHFAMGFTTVALFALLMNLFSKRKANRMLSIVLIVCFTIPIVSYILNGTLYIRDKSFIPFIPLVVLLFANFIDEFKTYKHRYFIIVGIVSGFLLWRYPKLDNVIMIDFVITVLLILLFRLRLKWSLRYMMIGFLCVAIWVNVKDATTPFLTTEKLNELANEDRKQLSEEITKTDDSFYRVQQTGVNSYYLLNYIPTINYHGTSVYSSLINKDYRTFMEDTLATSRRYQNKLIYNDDNNIILQTIMGAKYLITDQNPPVGYEAIKTSGKQTLYRNDHVFTVGYSTNSLYNYADFMKLSYGQKQEQLLRSILVEQEVDTAQTTTTVTPYKLAYEAEHADTIQIDSISENRVKIKASEDSTLVLNLQQPLEDQVLFISFSINNTQSCKIGDQIIKINGVTNLLSCKSSLYFNDHTTFTYALSSNEALSQLHVEFAKGTYDIENITTEVLDSDVVRQASTQVDSLVVDARQSQGDTIVGDIKVQADGYFVLNVPYDDAFTIKVNGVEQAYERVNGQCIGFPIKAGSYQIEVTYKANGLMLGLLFSLFAGSCFVAMFLLEHQKLFVKYREILMYLVFGAATTMLNILVYYLFHEVFGMYYLLSNGFAFFASVVFAYVTNKLYVFQQLDFSYSHLIKEFMSFLTVRGVSFLLDMGLMFLLVSILLMNDLYAKIAVNIVVIIVNYVASKWLVFRKEQ